MYLIGLGVIFMLMKYLEIGPVAAWEWWVVLLPFGLATAWWFWADSTGYTKRKAMERDDARRQARIDSNKEAMGTLHTPKRKR